MCTIAIQFPPRKKLCIVTQWRQTPTGGGEIFPTFYASIDVSVRWNRLLPSSSIRIVRVVVVSLIDSNQNGTVVSLILFHHFWLANRGTFCSLGRILSSLRPKEENAICKCVRHTARRAQWCNRLLDHSLWFQQMRAVIYQPISTG